jgi:hypothetical protein
MLTPMTIAFGMLPCPHEPLPSFGAFGVHQLTGDCKAASPEEVLRARSLRAPKLLALGYPYNRQQTSLRIAPCGAGVLSLMYSQNGDNDVPASA